jgi:protein SCO1/2
MQNTQNFSTNKIIVLVVFICAAIITSLFVFHSRNKQSVQSLLSPEVGIIFPVARDIKPFKLESANQQLFSQQNLLHHWTLLFFGFTHCSNVCPTTLEMINRVYHQLQPDYPNLQVVLISVDPERDTPESLASYTQAFNPKFMGVTGKIQELRKLQSQLGIYSAREPQSSDSTDGNNNSNYQIQHTSSILLINPQGKWAGLFKYGLNPDQFVQGFRGSVPSTSS